MCGACGERGATDWARPWVAGPGARASVARAVAQVDGSPGVRVSASAGGWLVTRPTGAATVCVTLGELVAAVRTTPPASFGPLGVRPSGRLAVAAADGRTGVVLRVDPAARPRADALSPDSGEVVVADDAAALAALAELATPPWHLRRYLARIEGVSAPWGRPPALLPAPHEPEFAADLLVRVERARQAGLFDDGAYAVRIPLDGQWLDVEIRAGHVVRARPL